jgi:hypothetical protein
VSKARKLASGRRRIFSRTSGIDASVRVIIASVTVPVQSCGPISAAICSLPAVWLISSWGGASKVISVTRRPPKKASSDNGKVSTVIRSPEAAGSIPATPN